MLSTIRPRLNHATIVAYLALFVALGGSSYSAVKISGKDIKNKSIAGKKLKNRTITKGKVKRNTLTGAEINESKLGAVPTASNAGLLAGLGPGAFLRSGGKAVDADKLDGIDSTGFLRNTPPEAYREVGSAGNPAFQNGCSNAGVASETAAFFKNQEGIVHLRGGITCPGGSAIAFQLPAGYLPATGKAHFEIVSSDGSDGDSEVQILGPGNGAPGNDGGVKNTAGVYVLDGVEFRAVN